MIHNSSFTIVGLGNPGEKYEKTRHNAGRMALEHFRKKHGLPDWERDSKRNALVSKGEVGGISVELLLPETFMNNSGLSLKPLVASGYGLVAGLVVVHDDLDIPIGTLKIVHNRGSAGHKGVESIIDALGTKEFTRIRIGISPLDESGEMRKPEGDAAAQFVLKKFIPAEETPLEDALRGASDALIMMLVEGKEKAMSVFGAQSAQKEKSHGRNQNAKTKIQALIDQYEETVNSGRSKKYTEEETKKDFILPLFEALGWEVYGKEVSAEEHIRSSGRVDYGFYLNERPKFYLEAKKLSADLHREDFARQAIRYAWNRGVTWAVLTDFESTKVFNAQVIDKDLGDKLFFEIPHTQYLERFDQLWLLSKEAFGKDLLDKEAEKFGKKLQKISITALLYKDLDRCREILTKTFSICNPGIPKDLIDEGVQKLLDRLIFLRVAEDRGVEPNTLTVLMREAEAGKHGAQLFKSMVAKFRELGETYDSELFSPHPFEEWDDFGDAVKDVIKILYGKKGYYEYDFKVMPADVLGGVYESYLGHKLSQSKKGLSLGKGANKRKEQGIYYTPAYIVDYIVKKALQPVLDKCRTIEDIKKIRVLDPACGSGSFLVKALDVIHDKYREFGNRAGVFTKLTILNENIYGVDLDPQAVEIARLNLLINSLDERVKLPLLADNIKNGNSLISGTDEELKKYFGPNYRDKKPFNWREEFPDAFKQGGFDVVIGNPPWVSIDNIDSQEKNYLSENYTIGEGRFDVATLFAERATTLLKEDGMISFVMPEHVWLGEYFKPFRAYLTENLYVLEILSSKEGDFKEVSNPSSLFVAKKQKAGSVHKIRVGSFSGGGSPQIFEVKTDIISRVIFDEVFYSLQSKIKKESYKELGEIALVTDGIQTADLLKVIFTTEPNQPENFYFKALRNGSAIRERYANLKWGGWYVLKPEHTREYKRPGFSYDSPKRTACFNAREKIILRQTEPTILATLDVDEYFFPNSIFQIALEKHDPEILRFLLGILNSNFIRHYYSKLAQVEGTTKPQMYLNILKTLPIPKKIDKNVVTLVDKILNLNKELQETAENSDGWKQLKTEIERTDKKIDEEVYKLYDLTEDEVKIVENQAK